MNRGRHCSMLLASATSSSSPFFLFYSSTCIKMCLYACLSFVLAIGVISRDLEDLRCGSLMLFAGDGRPCRSLGCVTILFSNFRDSEGYVPDCILRMYAFVSHYALQHVSRKPPVEGCRESGRTRARRWAVRSGSWNRPVHCRCSSNSP